MSLLSFENVTKHFPLPSSLLGRVLAGRKDRLVHAVNDVTLELDENETLGLVGESGSGKSTLGRVGIRLLKPTSGKVLFQGEDISTADGSRLRKIRREMQVIFQNPYSSLNPRKTIRQIVGAALKVRGIRDLKEQEEEICQLLRRVSLPVRFIDAYPHQLSGGQRQRISIIRALAVRPKLIVADEPTSGMDAENSRNALAYLRNLADQGRSVLLITHDIQAAVEVSDKVAVFRDGVTVEVAEAGDFKEPLNLRHPYTRQLFSALPEKEFTGAVNGHQAGAQGVHGCVHQNGCPIEADICRRSAPERRNMGNGWVRCHHA